MDLNLDDLFAHRLREAAGPEAPSVEELMRLLSWTSAHGDGWDSNIGLAPSRALPLMIAEDLGEAARPLADGFQRAHVTGVLLGIVLDRIADGQALADERLATLQGPLEQMWLAELGAALGSPALGAEWGRAALGQLRRAVLAEAQAFSARRLELADYLALVQDKLLWALLPAWGLAVRGRAQALDGVARAFAALLGGLQLFDDAVDNDEDRAHRGCGYGTLLGLPVPALEYAAFELNHRASELARAARLPTLAHFGRERATELEARRAVLIDMPDRLRGRVISLMAEDSFDATVRWLHALPRE